MYIQHLVESLEAVAIKCDGFKDGICHDATNVWIYGHHFGHPMQPETWSKLNHFCALRPAAATEIRTQSAYKGSVVGNDTLHISSVQDKAIPAMNRDSRGLKENIVETKLDKKCCVKHEEEVEPAKKQIQTTLSSLLHINIKSKAGNSMRLMPPNKIDSMRSEATCIGCNKSFSTAQGLGGHQVL